MNEDCPYPPTWNMKKSMYAIDKLILNRDRI